MKTSEVIGMIGLAVLVIAAIWYDGWSAHARRSEPTLQTICAECAGPLVSEKEGSISYKHATENVHTAKGNGSVRVRDDAEQHDTERHNAPASNRVHHVMMNAREYAWWLGFENSSEYWMRLYPEEVEL